ncbi:Brix-domain-containing protein [Xylariaceae sp. FL1651]|nr:Brix-domain-containing protein [Xylariaceae sp. FL1651]
MGSHRNRTLEQKRERAKEKREIRFRRKKEEDRDPDLRRARVEKNQPVTLDKKRVWDDVDNDDLTSSVDLEQLLKRRRIQQAEETERQEMEAARLEKDDNDDDDVDSMLGSDDRDSEDEAAARVRARQVMRDNSLAPSTTSTNLDLTPESLMAKFPFLFSDTARPQEPKILITTSLNSTLHDVAHIFQNIIPNSRYIPRSAHKYAHKYSVREISAFAENRGYSSLIVIREDQKKPIGLDVIDIPSKVAFHFSISSWVEGRKLPGHGNATNHYPVIGVLSPHTILSVEFLYVLSQNSVKICIGDSPLTKDDAVSTPLGLLTARVLQTLVCEFRSSLYQPAMQPISKITHQVNRQNTYTRQFPASPELAGRQCVMFHNSRDYMIFTGDTGTALTVFRFFRRHRYMIREKRATEKSVVGADGKEMAGVEGLRAGLQEIGPRFTLKLRRIDKGIGRAGSDATDPLHWEWKAKMEKKRTRFNL